MRFARTLAVLVALSLLARCGTAFLPTQHDPAPLFVAKAESAPVVAVIPEARPVAVVTPEVRPDQQQTQLAQVRELVRSLGTPGCGTQCILIDDAGQPLPGQERYQVKELRALGESAYADYQFILSDPKSEWEEIAGTCDIISRLPVARQFIPLLTQRLTAPDALVAGDHTLNARRRYIRCSIISTLEDIGDERDAAVLVPLLNEQNRSVRRDAVAALAKIGGRHELEALNTWLTGQNHDDPYIVRIRKFRDELGLRLLAQPQRRPF